MFQERGKISPSETQLRMAVLLSWLLVAVAAVNASSLVERTSSDRLASCPGYEASNVKTTGSSLTADLSLAGAACNAYGDDLTSLTLSVTYETGNYLIPQTWTIAEETQMTASTSRSKIPPTTSIRSLPASSRAHPHLQTVTPNTPTSNSNTSPRPSPSPLSAQKQEKCSSIHPPQVSYSRPNTSD